VCGVICSSDGTGETSFEEFVGNMPAISLMATSAVPFGSFERSDRRSDRFLTQLGNSNRSFLLAPEQRKLDTFGQGFCGKLRRLTTFGDCLDNPWREKRHAQ
jgi:hypothetical protein